ncbi:MAG: hypothetical protein ACRDF4_08145 [Rhabdochlamydiaceae bacterium]
METGISTSYPKLKKELDSWRKYSNQLYNEDIDLFKDMISRIWPSYAEAIEKSDRGYATEALLISLILSQQKTINWLLNRIKRNEESMNQEAGST